MSKIKVTGQNGFIGSHLVEHLENLGHQVNQGVGADYVFNLASRSDVEESIKHPLPVVLNNVGSTLEVLELARQHPPKAFVQFSTVEVYGMANPYAASKAAQDAIATSYANTYDLPIIITTTNNIVGAGQKGKFIPILIKQIKNNEEVSIYMDNGTMGYRTYNPIANVIDALVFIMNRPAIGLERYHLSGGQELSNLEMAQKIADLLGKPLKYKLIEASTVRPGYTRHLRSDGIRLEDLGWKPPQTLDEGLQCLM